MPKAKQSAKRILKVIVKRVLDDSPDTSWLGEYSNRATSEYSIDRAHSEDCASVSLAVKQASETLEHAQQTVGDLYNSVLAQYNGTLANEKLDTERAALDDAYNLLGELAEEVKECDCGERGDMGSRELRYFNPCYENYKGCTPEEIRMYCRQDYERMESYNNQDWYFMGIKAEAQIGIPDNPLGISNQSYTVQHITSGGVWGMESDSSKCDIEEAEETQLAELKTQLKALGFSSRAIATAFKNVEREEA